MEGGILGLGHFTNPAEHFAGRCLVETDLRIHQTDGFQQPHDPQCIHIGCQQRLIERSGHKTLCGQVVYFIRPVLFQGSDDIGQLQ